MSAAAGKSTARPSVSISRKRVKPRKNFLVFISWSTSEGACMPSEAYTWMCQTVSRAGKKMSRVVNWSIALLLSRSSPVIVFAPALDFNYLTPVPWPGASATIHEITLNRTNKAASCGFVDRLPCPADLKIGKLGQYSRQLFSCFASGRIVYLKTRKSSARPASDPFDGDNAVSPNNPLFRCYLPLEFP